MSTIPVRENTAFFSFGDWTVRPDQRLLERNGERVVLEPKLMDVLTYLAGTAGEVISAEQLLIDCWHGTFYGDNPVHKTIALLRKALGDDARAPRYIATVRKRGYQVLAEVAFADERTRGLPQSRTWTEGSPFRGLLLFEARHAPLFFGRARATSQLLAVLRAQRNRGCAFVLVTGPSGCGKSSLVNAGVLPALLRDAGSDGLRAIAAGSFTARPHGMAPHEALAMAMTRWHVRDRPIFLPTEWKALAYLLMKDMPMVLERIAHALRDERRDDVLVLMVDTVEALVATPALAPDECAAFVGMLAQLARSGRVVVLALCRNDFYPQLMAINELLALKRDGGLYDVAMPTEGEIAQMIRLPAMAAGLHFERDAISERQLDDVLLEAACRRPGALPMLQYTLQALYDLRGPKGLLTFTAYRELGGLEGALSRQAEAVFTRLDVGAGDAFARVLRRLVAVAADSDDVTARTVRWRDLDDREERQVVQFLVDEHLFISLLEGGEACFTVAHEALLRHWPRVVEWLEAHRAMLRSRARIADMARRWLTEGRRHEHLLPRGLLLADAGMLYQQANPPLAGGERLFVRRSLQRVRMKKWLLVGTFALIAMLAVFSFMASVMARRAEVHAKQRQSEAENLLDFMLGDLHERLDALGRLDLMDAVTSRALTVLDHDPETDDPAYVLRRARVLREIGEIRFTRGDLGLAEKAFDAAHASLHALLRRDVRLPTVYAELGQLDFWRGQIASSQNHSEQAHAAWQAYLADAEQRAALQPDAPDAWLELSYANNCLGTFALRADRLDEASERFHQSIAMKQRYLAARTSDDKVRLELADTMSWLALVEQQQGLLRDALESFRAERQTVAAAGGTGISSNTWKYRRALANLHTAKAESDLGLAAEAAQDYASAAITLAELVDEVPDNRTWQRDLAYAHLQRGWLADGMGDTQLAWRELAQAESRLRALLTINPKMADWRMLLAMDHNYQAVVLLQEGQPAEAAATMTHAWEALPPIGKSATGQIIKATLGVTSAEVAAMQGDEASMTRDATQVIQQLAPRIAATPDPRLLDPYVRALFLLGRRHDAEPYLQRLNQAGYHPPMFEPNFDSNHARNSTSWQHRSST